MRKDAAAARCAPEMEKALFRDPNFIVVNALQPGVKVRGLQADRPTAASTTTRSR